ncbi:hypothetical protein MSHOH_2625 [Methanosarcina horonobensis HB-1 = JCM 15518]|uniref:Uncharacterized protein n=2 Tax=Methanosarcina horonobensis TaxID=418008 RepID=A0A0E3SHC1_9EURY|nr:hypothetical protein MSHOH_2625 [Methanosarcina horonobensis HB-1 = JCM 15518]
MENIIKSLYPEAEFHYKGVIDFVIDGVKVENKSCQEYINATGNHNGMRSGRFCFDALQHQTLIEQGGDYSFLVQKDSNPIFFARVHAKNLKLGKWSGVKAVCWKTIMRMVI